jgi:hypothetical protein
VKGILIHVTGAVLTFIVAVLFMLFLNGMLSSKPPFIAGHRPAAAPPDSTAAEAQPAPPAEEGHSSTGSAVADSARTGSGTDGMWQPVPPIDTGLHDLPRGADEPASETADASDEGTPGADAPAEDTSPAPPSDGPQLARLVRVYEKMRPKQVAQVFDSLPDDQTVAMLSKMSERAAAKVIAAMDPTNAARLSQMLVRTGMP